MKKTIYWKDIRRSLLSSKGRFLSIFSLMMLGSLALTGLKVTAPNMDRTAQSYIEANRTMDLAVMSELGITQDDMKELQTIEGATVEPGYFKDVVLRDNQQAVRIFSQPEEISLYKLVEGEFPTAENQIALSPSLKSSYQIGDTFNIVEPDKNGTVLKESAFTVVGFVASSEIWDNVTMGMASSGTGQLTGYAIVPSSAFSSDVYMIARLSYDDLAKISYSSDKYSSKLEKHKEDLETLVADNDEQRMASIQADGQEEISKGEADIAKAQQELADAEKEIQDGNAQLATGREEFARGRAKIIQSEQELQTAHATLLETKARLETSMQQLDDSKQKLDQTKAFLDASANELNQAANLLQTAKAELENQNQQLNQLGATITSGRSAWNQAQNELNALITSQIKEGENLSDYPELLARQEAIDAEKIRLDQLEASYEQAHTDYLSGYNLLQTKQTEYQMGLDQYNKWNAEYQAGLAQYNAGLKEFENGYAAYQKGVADYEWGVQQLQSSSLTLDQEELRLNQADEELSKASEEFSTQKAQADKEISEAQNDIAEAKSELSNLEKSSYQIYTRSTLPGSDGYVTYQNATKSIAAVGNVFPVVLYLVAALVTFTTMARFVDEERTQSGLFKALGYTNKQIMAKFVLYGLGAGLAGAIVGITLGNTVLSPLISSIITETTVIGASTLYFYPLWTSLAIGLTLLSAVLPAYLVAQRELFEKPASLLLPKPPVSGSKILLERWRFVWSRLSFTHKVTARNIFRYKLRMLMTIFGVAGTVALLFGGLGIRSSISGVVDRQFGDLIHYDMLVVENSKASEEELDGLSDFLQSNQVRQSLPVAFEQITEKITSNDQEKTVSISLYITDRPDMGRLIELETSKGKELTLTGRGVILTEKLAQLYDVAVGDKLKLTLNDKEVEVRVDGIADMYAGHFIFMTDEYYQEVTGSRKLANAYLVELKKDSAQHVQEVSSQLLDMTAVKSLVQNTSLMAMLTTMAASLQSVMTILVVLSILLGLVILYNLTIINMSERIRELSTIRVLGFHNKEVTLYIYRETIALSIIGIVAGLIGGFYLHRLLLYMIGSDSIRFNPEVGVEVYLIPILAIVGILAFLGWYVNHQLRKVDMLEALKSID
ncbi:TPA: FtsX-like permease family protein [Streptococcus suis]|nr:FtsX-like permease family protein [Streptococcus suis]